MPPFQLMAMTFAVAFLLAALKWLRDALVVGGEAFAFLRQPWPAWTIGVGGLFLYHLFYFVALDHAPAVGSQPHRLSVAAADRAVLSLAAG